MGVGDENSDLPANFEEETLLRLKSVMRMIFLNGEEDPCIVDLLREDVGRLCSLNMVVKIYEGIETEFEAHAFGTIQALVGQSQDNTIGFLTLVQRCWQDTSAQVHLICDIVPPLYRTHVRQAVLQIFQEQLSSQKVEHRTVAGLLRLIEKERLGECESFGGVVDKALYAHILEMFKTLGSYSEIFEKVFLESSAEFYKSEGAKHMQKGDIQEYLQYVQTTLQDEEFRCLEYLDPNTTSLLITTVEKEIFENQLPAIIDKGFAMLMEGKSTQDLKQIFRFCPHLESLDSIEIVVSAYIKKTGQGIFCGEKIDEDTVKSLLQFKRTIDVVWEEFFCKVEAIRKKIDETFYNLINSRQDWPPEVITKIMDGILKAKYTSASEEELLFLVKFIQEKVKDEFEASYGMYLAKRLLFGSRLFIDAEKSMIAHLKSTFGGNFTCKLETMIKDCEFSEEINESFKQFSQNRLQQSGGLDLSVQVLTKGVWPTYATLNVKLPYELRIHQNAFEDFYWTNHNAKRLMWDNSLAHGVVEADTSEGKREVTVSLYQVVVLMLYNDDQKKLHFQYIKNSTGIEDNDLRSILQSLTCGQDHVLSKEPEGDEVNDKDFFLSHESTRLCKIQLTAFQIDSLPAAPAPKINVNLFR